MSDEFASNCCPNCGHVLQSPKGKPNQTVMNALEQYPEMPRRFMVCPKHGLWFDRLDDLWPVYWQNNKCKECK